MNQTMENNPMKQSAEGAIATAATAVAGGLESVEDAIATVATAVVGGLESAEGAIATAATAVAGGLESAEGAVATAATAVAGGLESASSYLQRKEFAEMASDLTVLIRRYPVQSLLVGMGFGYVLARLTTR
jgi:phage-related protein